MIKIGLGYDLHRLEAGRPLWIGGIKIESETGSVAHSDGDVLIHSIIDAMLSPLNLGDIGQLFPDTDARWKDAESIALLRNVMSRIPKQARLLQIDSTIVLDKPKIASYIPQMKAILSQELGIEASNIGIKGKTSEKTNPDVIECTVICLMDSNG